MTSKYAEFEEKKRRHRESVEAQDVAVKAARDATDNPSTEKEV